MQPALVLVLAVCAALHSHVGENGSADLSVVEGLPRGKTRLYPRHNTDPSIVDWTGEPRIDVGDLKQYVMLQRRQFTAEKLRYVVEHEPQSIVVFRDTNTVLVPHRDILDLPDKEVRAMVRDGAAIEYEEVDVADCLGVQMSTMLIPATACLSRQSLSGQGQLSFKYAVSIEYGGQGDLSFGAFAGLFNFTVAFSVTKRIKVARTVSYSGTHSCDMANSLLVRLFYSPGTVQVQPRTRRIRYRVFDRAMEEADWLVALRIKLLVESVPIFYCATDRLMDLKCHETVSEYFDEEGNMYKSVFDDGVGGIHSF